MHRTAPPVILGDEPGTFPHGVLAERHPAIIRQVLDAHPYGPAQRRALDDLLDNCLHGTVRPLPDDAHDADAWRAWGMDAHAGRPWFALPWLWAESYFHRLLLEATGYFRPGPWQGVDPFRPAKLAELHAPAADEEIAALDDLAGRPAGERETALLHGSLWGNRADLGFRLGDSAAEDKKAAPALVADDTAALRALLDRADTVALVADNAGRELVPDLLLLAHLLGTGRVRRAVLHVKPYPYFVSDATAADALDAVRRLRDAPGEAGRYGATLWAALADGTLDLRAHPFSAAPLPYAELPGDLRAEFAAADLTVLKGDLNYRRLVGDRRWPPTTPFAEVTAHFPGPVAALRTLKSEVVTGLDARTVTALTDAEGERWRVSGTHALVQVSPGGARPPRER